MADATKPEVTQKSLNALLDAFERHNQLEEMRLEVESGKKEVALRIVEASDDSDKRRHEERLMEIQGNEQLQSRRFRQMASVLWCVVGLSSLIVVPSVYFAFWGTEAQSEAAWRFLGYAIVLVGGGGIFRLASPAFKGLFDR